jgi:hypothetical protein
MATVAVAGIGLIVSACSSTAPDLVINGVVEVATSPPPSGTDCRVAARLADVTSGAHILVTDAAGTQVGQGTLRSAKDWSPCNLRYDFQVVGVSAGRGPYGLEVAGHGRVLYSENALRAGAVDLPVS